MLVFFKKNIDWLADHAPDPDMRRYATSWEAPRHYIDLDNYGAAPYDDLARTWPEALLQHADVWGLNAAGDTVMVFGGERSVPFVPDTAWLRYYTRHLLPNFTDDEKKLDVDALNAFRKSMGNTEPDLKSAFFRESLSAHGILPWHLQRMQRDLTSAFRRRDSKRILRLCADMGHYIGDAHVPLHTTSNYNGAKTKQDGIHGFWESRIPELFADEQYDYMVGKAEYIAEPTTYFWDVVLTSNRLVDSVLTIEKNLRLTFPADRQICPDMRAGVMINAPCREFAAAYQDAMNSMVERRMRASIHTVASAWYTAWVDAGQPDLRQMDAPLIANKPDPEETEVKKAFEQGAIQGRPEDH